MSVRNEIQSNWEKLVSNDALFSAILPKKFCISECVLISLLLRE